MNTFIRVAVQAFFVAPIMLAFVGAIVMLVVPQHADQIISVLATLVIAGGGLAVSATTLRALIRVKK